VKRWEKTAALGLFSAPFLSHSNAPPTGRPAALVEILPSAEVVLLELLELEIEVPAPGYAILMPDHMHTDLLKALAERNSE